MPNQPRSDQPETPENALLAQLPAVDLRRLTEHLELVKLPAGHVLHERDQPMSHAYFPTDCVVSLRFAVDNGMSAQLAVVGQEGMIGMAIITGGHSSISQAVLPSAGHAYRLPASVLKSEFDRGGPLSELLLKSSASVITQMAEAAALSQCVSSAFASSGSFSDAASTYAGIPNVTSH